MRYAKRMQYFLFLLVQKGLRADNLKNFSDLLINLYEHIHLAQELDAAVKPSCSPTQPVPYCPTLYVRHKCPQHCPASPNEAQNT